MMIAGFPVSDPVPDSGPPNQFLGYDKALPRVDGSGVLVRLTFHANAPGVSTASISYNPVGPHLINSRGSIGDVKDEPNHSLSESGLPGPPSTRGDRHVSQNDEDDEYSYDHDNYVVAHD